MYIRIAILALVCAAFQTQVQAQPRPDLESTAFISRTEPNGKRPANPRTDREWEAARADDAAAYWRSLMWTAVKQGTLPVEAQALYAKLRVVERDCLRVPSRIRGEHCEAVLDHP